MTKLSTLDTGSETYHVDNISLRECSWFSKSRLMLNNSISKTWWTNISRFPSEQLLQSKARYWNWAGNNLFALNRSTGISAITVSMPLAVCRESEMQHPKLHTSTCHEIIRTSRWREQKYKSECQRSCHAWFTGVRIATRSFSSRLMASVVDNIATVIE